MDSAISVVAVVTTAVLFMVCWVFAAVVTESILASTVHILQAHKRKKLMRWRNALFGFIWVVSLGCAAAAVLLHGVVIFPVILACMGAAGFVQVLNKTIQDRFFAKNVDD